MSGEALRRMAEVMVGGSPQIRALGLEIVSVEPGQAVLRCPYAPALVGDAKTRVIAGGVVTTLLDHTCGLAVVAAMEVPAAVATLNLHIDYMRASEPDRDLYAYAHCYRMTRSVAFVRAVAYERERDNPVSTVQATFMLKAPAAGRDGRS